MNLDRIYDPASLASAPQWLPFALERNPDGTAALVVATRPPHLVLTGLTREPGNGWVSGQARMLGLRHANTIDLSAGLNGLARLAIFRANGSLVGAVGSVAGGLNRLFLASPISVYDPDVYEFTFVFEDFDTVLAAGSYTGRIEIVVEVVTGYDGVSGTTVITTVCGTADFPAVVPG